MNFNQIKSGIAEFEIQKFENIMKLTENHLEAKFLSSLYYFFLKNDCSMHLEIISPLDVESWNDDKLKSFWNYWKLAGDKSLIKQHRVFDKSVKQTGILCGFWFRCFNVIYRVFPQLPIFDDYELRIADFVIEMRSTQGETLKNYIIECDGFKYHGTKEQINRDNQRTRFLASHGYTVIRYSFSEIENIDDNFFFELENSIYRSVFKSESSFYSFNLK